MIKPGLRPVSESEADFGVPDRDQQKLEPESAILYASIDTRRQANTEEESASRR